MEWLRAPIDLFREIFVYPQPADERLWHKCYGPVFPPRRSIEGKWMIGAGQVWRRRVGGKWEYRQDEETDEEWQGRW